MEGSKGKVGESTGSGLLYRVTICTPMGSRGCLPHLSSRCSYSTHCYAFSSFSFSLPAFSLSLSLIQFSICSFSCGCGSIIFMFRGCRLKGSRGQRGGGEGGSTGGGARSVKKSQIRVVTGGDR